MPVEPGLVGRVVHVVAPTDLATALGSGSVDVLATPRLLAWAEAACVVAIDGRLDTGETTVGMRTQLDHLHASLVGAEIECSARVERVEGRRLTFTVSAHDGAAEIASGHLTRVIVEEGRFMERTRSQPTTSQ